MSESLERGELFRVTDPLGRVIRCIQETWIGHVLHQRAWMAGWEEDVKEAVAKPGMGIYISPHAADREIYYSYLKAGRLPGRRQYLLKVVVQINANTKTGEVIMAHPATKGQRGEKLRWI